MIGYNIGADLHDLRDIETETN